MSITIKNLEDLRQLEGWVIDKITYEPPGMKFRLTHIAAPVNLIVTFSPTLSFGLSGNLMTATLGLNMDVKEIPVET